MVYKLNYENLIKLFDADNARKIIRSIKITTLVYRRIRITFCCILYILILIMAF